MLGKLLGHDKRQIEYVFGASSVTLFARRDRVEDPRRWGDLLLFRKLRTAGPAWSEVPDGFELVAGGGALGEATIWTRPVELEALDLENAWLQVHERRATAGGAGGLSVVAHVRAKAVVGPSEDVETRSFPIHAHEDAPDEGWHTTAVDLAPVLRKHVAQGRFLTLEVKAESTRGALDPRGLVVGLRPLVLTFTAAPRAPMPAWAPDAVP